MREASLLDEAASQGRITEMTGREPAAPVLIVDDDVSQRSDLAEMVTSLGFAATTAADGQEALSILESASPSAILTDLVMPCKDGVELLKELTARGNRTPTIVRKHRAGHFNCP